MKRSVNERTLWALRKLLRREFDAAMDKIKDNFRHDFTKEKPCYEVALRVDAHEFASTVMEAEISELKRQLKEHMPMVCSNTLSAALEITETLHEFGPDVVAHQKRGDMHRLVLCHRPPPQVASEWVVRGNCATLNEFCATWDGGVEQCPF